MANWASTDYVIEGSKESLIKIYNAIKNPDTSEGDEGWEGGVLKALGISWEERNPNGSGYYMRGFIQDVDGIEFNPETDDTLSFYAEEAWGATDFNEVLEKEIPDIKVYYCVEEEGEGIYATNDKEGKYFTYRWNIDACINGSYEYEDFLDKKSLYNWLSNKTEGKVKNEQDVEDFNSAAEDECTDDENYIYIHEFDIID